MPVRVVWGGPRVGNSYKRGEALGCRGRECLRRSQATPSENLQLWTFPTVNVH